MSDVEPKVLNLHELFEQQRRLQSRMGWPGGSPYTPIAGARTHVLAAMAELTEFLDELPWKPWKPEGYKEIDRDAAATELTDVFQFLANAALCLGFTPEDLTTALRRKWVVNHARTDAGKTTAASSTDHPDGFGGSDYEDGFGVWRGCDCDGD